jgi:AraC-like DNA-binding protein
MLNDNSSLNIPYDMICSVFYTVSGRQNRHHFGQNNKAENNVIDMSDYGFACVPAVKQYLQAAEACGVDYRSSLDAVGINPALLENNNKRVTGEALERLLALLIPASGDPCFGLHAARFIEPASYSVLGYISMNCSTLRETLANTSVYEKIVGDMGVSSINIADGMAFLRWDCQFKDPLVRRHLIENVLGSWDTFLRNFMHLDPGLADCVWFEHSPPADRELLEDYRAIFGCEILFDQSFSGIRFKEELLDMSLPQADKRLLRTLLDHATEILAEIDKNQPVSIQVKNILRLILKEHEPSSAQIASILNMSFRTLQRRLAAENTQYKQVLDDVRLEMALYYLQSTTLSLDQIAYELGYAETRSFYRSFKHWTGRTAGSYRTSKA